MVIDFLMKLIFPTESCHHPTTIIVNHFSNHGGLFLIAKLLGYNFLDTLYLQNLLMRWEEVTFRIAFTFRKTFDNFRCSLNFAVCCMLCIRIAALLV